MALKLYDNYLKDFITDDEISAMQPEVTKAHELLHSGTGAGNGVIAGWTEGVQLMSEGAKYRFFIPYQLAYGERGAGAAIPPFAALVFDVELIKVM